MHATCRNRRGLSARTLVVTLAQLSAALLLPVLDGHLEAEAFHAPLHIDTQDSDCAPAHDELFCQVLRSLGHGSPTPEVTAGRSAATLFEVATVPPSSARPRFTRVGGSGPRAPPVS